MEGGWEVQTLQPIQWPRYRTKYLLTLHVDKIPAKTFRLTWHICATGEYREKKTAFDVATKRNTKKAEIEDEDWRTITRDRRLCRKVIQKATELYSHSHL